MSKHRGFFNWVGILLLMLVFVSALGVKLAGATIITGPGANGGGGTYNTSYGGGKYWGWVQFNPTSIPGNIANVSQSDGDNCHNNGYPILYALLVPNSNLTGYKTFQKNIFNTDGSGNFSDTHPGAGTSLDGGKVVEQSTVETSYNNNKSGSDPSWSSADFGWMCGGTRVVNHPPTGSISVSCNTNGTGKATGTFSDPDGPTTATLTVTAGSPNYSKTFSGNFSTTIPVANASSGSWTATLVVKDNGGSSDQTYSASSASCNKNPVGNINTTPTGSITPSCQAVKLVVVNDPNTPSANITYYLSVNGGAKQSGVAQQSKLPFDITISGYPGFNAWANNTVDLYAKDIQTGAVVGVLDSVTLPTCNAVSCGTSNFGSTATVGVTKNFYVTMNYGPLASPPPPGAQFTINITGPINQSYTNIGTASTSSPAKSNPVSFTPTVAGTYNLSWTYDGVTCPPGPGPSITIGYSPYFNVLGGDIAAGPGFGPNCTSAPAGTAGISGTNIDTSGSGPFFGAGTDRAAFATGDITSFATSQTPLGTDASSGGLIPKGLSFANNQAGGTKYGNDFSRSGWCMPDYTAVKNVATGGIDLLTPGTRTYKITGPYTLPSATLGLGVHVTIIVNGDAYITGDIKYDTGYTTSSVDQIPQLKLIVTGGNLYIANTVQELHGFYAAQPSSGTGGDINTCAIRTSNGSSISISDATYYSDCNHQLTIYGGVAAAKLDLERTWGNLVTSGAVQAQPAESFVFTPELWLGNLQGPSGGAEPVQAFTSLPPNL